MPAKHTQVTRRFCNPRAHKHWPGWLGHRIRPAQPAQKQKFEAKDGEMNQEDRETDRPSKPRMVRPKQPNRKTGYGH